MRPTLETLEGRMTPSAFAGPQTPAVFGGPANDSYVGTVAHDVVYDLLGSNTVDVRGGQPDLVITNAQSTVLADDNDFVVRFFGPNRLPGAGTVELENGTLYITPPNNGSSVTVADKGGQVVVATDFAGTLTFDRHDVKLVAYFGGSGNDTFVNDTKLDTVAYGGGGNDTLVGGTGFYDILKGLSGNDVLVGRARSNDLSGNGGLPGTPDGPDILSALAGAGHNVFRVDATDTIQGGPVSGDTVFSS